MVQDAWVPCIWLFAETVAEKAASAGWSQESAGWDPPENFAVFSGTEFFFAGKVHCRAVHILVPLDRP